MKEPETKIAQKMNVRQLEERFRRRKARQDYDIANKFINPAYEYTDMQLKYWDEIES